MQMKTMLLALVCASLTVVGCDDGDGGGGGGADMGMGGAGGGAGGEGGGGDDPAAYYSGAQSAALGAADNEARCSTCHTNDGTQVGFSGNSLMDMAYRASFKGGAAPTLLDGANACITGWMGGTALTAADAEWVSLEAYIQSISDAAVTDANPIEPEVLENEAAYEAAYTGGDAARGETLYPTACGTCHDADLTVNNRVSFSIDVLAAYQIGRIAQKVRTSGPPPSGMEDATDTTPGPMPFFELKDLPAQDLADIIAYIKAQAG